jgi:hypothetical protein
MRTLLALLFVLMACAAEEAEMTPEQKLAALVFTDVQAIDVTTLIEVEMPSDRPDGRHAITAAAVHPSRTIAKDLNKELLAMIAATGNYHFDGTAMCFEPGLRIRIHEKQRITTLSVCLSCAKMSVSTAGRRSFIIDFSPTGLLAYKATYLDLIVLKKGQGRE